MLDKKISQELLANFNINMDFLVNNSGVNARVKGSSIRNSIRSILSGAGAPSSTPSFVGQIYIDTTGNRKYYAVGTSSSADWRKVGMMKYFTATVTGGGGDFTVNFDIDITDALIIYARSGAAGNYFQGGVFDNGALHVTSYDALSNASYTLEHLNRHNTAGANWHSTAQKTDNVSGLAKSVTTTSVTFDDDGVNTVYVRGFIIG